MSEKKISKRTREQAAMICAIAASDTVGMVGSRTSMSDTFGRCNGADMALARAALWSVESEYSDTRQRWACAEALLRTGWSPS